MQTKLNYNPITLIEALQFVNPRPSLYVHYLAQTLKKVIQPIRKQYDFEAGGDFIQMLQLRQGFARTMDQKQKVQDLDSQICYYRPRNFDTKKKVTINGHEYELDAHIDPIRDSDQFSWLYIIDGQILYDNTTYYSGAAIELKKELHSTVRQVQNKKFSLRSNSIMAIFPEQKQVLMQRLMFIRERSRKINFLKKTPFKILSEKKLISLYEEMLIVDLKMGQKVQEVAETAYFQKAQLARLPIISEVSLAAQLTQNMQRKGRNIEIPPYVFVIYKGEVSQLGQPKRSGQGMIQIRRLTQQSIFAGMETFQYLTKSLKNAPVQNQVANLLVSFFGGHKQPAAQQPGSSSEEQQKQQSLPGNKKNIIANAIHEAKSKFFDSGPIAQLNIHSIQDDQIKSFHYKCTSDSCTLIAIPTEKIIQLSILEHPKLRRNLTKILKEKAQQGQQLLRTHSQKKVQILNRQATCLQRNNKSLNSSPLLNLIVSQFPHKSNFYFQASPHQIKRKRVPNRIPSSARSESAPRNYNSSKQYKKNPESDSIYYKTLQTTHFDSNHEDTFDVLNRTSDIKKTRSVSDILKNRAKTVEANRRTQKEAQQEGSLIINAPFKKFFIPQQFVSKKNRLQYEFVLKKMRKTQKELSLLHQQRKTFQAQKEYVRQFINDRRIVKKMPKRKFLPIYESKSKVKPQLPEQAIQAKQKNRLHQKLKAKKSKCGPWEARRQLIIEEQSQLDGQSQQFFNQVNPLGTI